MSPGLAVGFAGAAAAGAVLRVALDRALHRQGFPLGILVVNITGSFVLGLVVGAVRSGSLDSDLGTVLGTGLCGAFTTFSTFTVDTARLLADRRLVAAGVNALASMVLCLLAAGIGVAVSG